MKTKPKRAYDYLLSFNETDFNFPLGEIQRLRVIHYMELINLWVETLIEFGFSSGEIKIQLSIIYNSFGDETICTSIKFFLNDSERLN